MGFNNYKTQVFLRVLLLLITIFLLASSVFILKYTLTSVFLLLLVFLQACLLVRYLNKTNRKLSQFLESIHYSDFSSSFTGDGLGREDKELNSAFNRVIGEFKKNRAEKEEQYNYLQTVVGHIRIGLLSFNREGRIDLYNNAIKKMFRIINLHDIRELDRIKPGFSELLMNIKPGDRTLLKIIVEDELKQLLMYATEFKMRGEELTLVSIQDIHSELEVKELESWQNLIRVLTHEIMNSITPISSLASTVKEMALEEAGDEIRIKDIDKEDAANIGNALTTIQKRSQGLLNFVDIYRNLTRIPKPNFRYFLVTELFERSKNLLMAELDSRNINCHCKVFPEELMLTADPDLIEQVIINLVLNSIDAVKGRESPEISLVAYSNEHNRVMIDVVDNGCGIKPDLLDKIFMPFFTSKDTGSGIGLSLSRQIMHLHNGMISVKSKPEEGSVFTLSF
jgi:nitrogen fixation/metabolism regulation signal transduction histidine kinase